MTRSHLEIQAFYRSLEVSNASALRLQALCGVLGHPLFALLDYVVIPESDLWLFLLMRLFNVLVGSAAFGLSFFRRFHSFARVSGVVLAWLSGFSVALMIRYLGGYASTYYAGFSLVILITGFLFAWSWRWNIVMGLPLWLAYLLPSVLYDPITDLSSFFAHNFFIIFTLLFVTVVQVFNFRRRRQSFFDNLDLKKAKASLEEAHDELQRLDHLKSQFFANITHELRTPLTLILAPVESILQGDLGDFRSSHLEYFRGIRENGLRLLKLINDLLELSRLEDSQVRLRIEETRIDTFVQGIVDASRGLSERKNIQISMDVAPVTLWFDPLQMERVFLNIFANSLKFTEPGGKIWIRGEEFDDRVELSVEDTGVGISQEHLPEVFERFFQSDGSNTRRFGGTGIGLALARELVELHSAQIWAESVFGEGTTMHVTLYKGRDHFVEEHLDRRQRDASAPPLQRRIDDDGVSEWTHQIFDQESFRFLDIDLATERRVIRRVDSRIKEARVLIVEDNVEMLRFLNTMLSERYEIFTAQDGVDGLALTEECKPDLIISDVMMPRMDGYELCARLKSAPQTMNIPVILLTARSEEKDRVMGREQGADAYLGKPFSPRELFAVVKEALHSRARTARMVLDKQLDDLQILSARMAHEIFNPLNVVKNASEAMLAEIEDELSDEMKSRIKPFEAAFGRAVQRIQSTVEMMKRYSHEGYEPKIEAYSLRRALDETLLLVGLPQSKKHRYELDVQSTAPVWCQPAELHQALANIIENAMDAVGEHKEALIEFRIYKQEKFVTLEIEDNGVGMDADEVSRMFTPFYTAKPPGQGMGLGLTISLQVIQSFGGHIEVYSKKGEGTRVCVSLSRADVSESERHSHKKTLPQTAQL